VRGVLGHVGGGAAVFAAQRQALREPQHHEDDRGEEADFLIGRQHPDERGRKAHHEDRDEKGVLAADKVADAAEHERAERPHREAHAEQREAGEKAGGLIARREKQFPEKHGEGAVDIKVIPLEDRTEG
jgi:hypothetical protein